MLISNFHDNNGSLSANDRLNRIEIIDFLKSSGFKRGVLESTLHKQETTALKFQE